MLMILLYLEIVMWKLKSLFIIYLGLTQTNDVAASYWTNDLALTDDVALTDNVVGYY